MRLRSFARTWQDRNRKRDDNEEVPRGPIADWVTRIQNRMDQPALDDLALINAQRNQSAS